MISLDSIRNRKALTVTALTCVILIFGAYFIPAFSLPIEPQNFEVSQASDLTYSLQINVIFVGFTPGIVDTSLLNSGIQKSYPYTYDGYVIDYGFNLSYYEASEAYYLALRDFCFANSMNGTDTTSALNTTALQIQINTGQRMSIFLPQSGRAIEAKATEHWLDSYPYLQDAGPSYNFYVTNFTELDTPQQNLKHWFNLTETDYEANRSRDFWRLEWDNELNPNVKFPYALFTSDTRNLIIDPSAFQWYLTWARYWYNLQVSGLLQYDYYFEDLYQFQLTHDVNTPSGKSALAYYLAGWINDPIENLLVSYLWTDSRLANAKTVSIQTLILNNATESGYTNSVMNWIVNDTIAEQAIRDLAPFINVTANTEFHQLSEYPELKQAFLNAVIDQTNGWTYYSGNTVWNTLYALRSSYFDLAAADVVVNAYVLLEENMSMMANNREWTGLGGDGQILVMKEVKRYFETDGVTPKSGLGMVLIHEAGHNLGFPHTAGITAYSQRYAGDFSFDVMGYYPYAYNFSQFRKDCFRRLVVDLKTFNLEKKLNNDINAYSRKPPVGPIESTINDVDTLINTTRQLSLSMNYLQAYDTISEAEISETTLARLISIYLADVNNDGIIDILDVVKVAGVYGTIQGEPQFRSESDLNKDGVIDIIDIVMVASCFGSQFPL